ncbi:MAG TPA: threonine--tRNA ligase [Candidatus Eisenbacteria bacterium]|nr:threonine--tRNA ligase [Candidatus Eisenbacteria bacterium]
MSDITVTFAEGAPLRLPAGVTAGDALRAHGEQNGTSRKELKRAIAAKVEADGATRIVDLGRALTQDCRVTPVVPDSPDGLEVLRHSSAHLMAHAITRLYPGTEITIGPVVENGFYYDVKRPEGFTPEDLALIEDEMRKIARENHPVVREEVTRDDAIRLFRDMGQKYKVEIIEGLPAGEPISLYRQGDFVDLCRGPHVPSTGRLDAFKLTSIAGAYWRGDANNEQLQRLYGTAWATKQDLDAYLRRVEEAKQRDHRRLGQVLDLFSFNPLAPGSPFFHPKGAIVYNMLVEYVRRLYARYGYTEVITPLIFKTELWKKSGHYGAFREDMFLMKVDEDEYGVKPMNCPGHCELFAAHKHSYRDLPIRYADFSRLHRFEPSGTLQGLTRVRSLAQDDAHIYCTPDQVDGEIDAFVAMVKEVYAAFGFDRVEVSVQTRPKNFLGRVELWDTAEATLHRAAEKTGYPTTVLPGEGAFYGPKIGFDFRDVLERSWTLATVQIDCAMPERFGLRYVTSDGTEATPMMVHRAVLGSLERFIAILLEHTNGKLPLWLAPEQVRVIPVSEKVEAYARRVEAACRAAGLRAESDLRGEKLGYKIREAQVAKVPVMAVIGEREAADGTVAPRVGGNNEPAVGLDAFVTRVATDARMPGGGS